MTKETIDLMEELVADNLTDLNTRIQMEEDERKRMVNETVTFIDKMNESERLKLEYQDKEARRKFEENRARNEAESEEKINKRRAIIELGKTAITVIIPLIAYDLFQRRVIKFEETGRFTSFASRELHLPKIFNK